MPDQELGVKQAQFIEVTAKLLHALEGLSEES
jgi:hypothetical protein